MTPLPPGLQGFVAAQQQAQQQQMGQLQQAQALMGMQEAMQKRAQEERLRSSVAAGNGDLDAVLATLLKSGDLAGAAKLAPLVEAKRKAGGQQFAPPEIVRLQEYERSLPEGDPRKPPVQARIRMLSERQSNSGSEPLHPIVGEDGKPTLVPRSQAIGQTPYNASIAGAGSFSEEALTSVAEQYLAGDRQAIQGFARNATARIALQNKIAQLAKERGWKGEDIAAQMADFAGILSGSRTVGQRAAQIELASNEAEKMIDIVLDQSKKFERTKFVPLNAALRAFESKTGQPEVKAFGMAINSLVNVYARAISPSGVPTVSDKEHAREILSAADSPEQVQAVMDVMRQEMQAARAAPSDVRSATRRAVISRTPAATPTASPDWTPEKERRYQELKRKQGGN